jgi:hypothetical protein
MTIPHCNRINSKNIPYIINLLKSTTISHISLIDSSHGCHIRYISLRSKGRTSSLIDEVRIALRRAQIKAESASRQRCFSMRNYGWWMRPQSLVAMLKSSLTLARSVKCVDFTYFRLYVRHCQLIRWFPWFLIEWHNHSIHEWCGRSCVVGHSRSLEESARLIYIHKLCRDQSPSFCYVWYHFGQTL